MDIIRIQAPGPLPTDLPPLSRQVIDTVTDVLTRAGRLVPSSADATVPGGVDPVILGVFVLVAGVVVVAVGGWVIAAVAAGRRHRHQMRFARLVTITPPPEVDPDGARVFWATLSETLTRAWRHRWLYGRSHVAVEYRWAGRELTINVWVPTVVPAGAVHAAVRGAWPGAACTTTNVTVPLPRGGVAVGGALVPALPAWFPLTVDHPVDPMRTLIAVAAGMPATEAACVQVLARPATPRQVTRVRRGVMGLRAGHPTPGVLESVVDPAAWLRVALGLAVEVLGPTRRTVRTAPRDGHPATTGGDPQRERDARAGVDKLSDRCWEVAIRYAVTHTNPRPAGTTSTVLAARSTPTSARRTSSRRLRRGVLRARLRNRARGISAAYGAWAGRNRFRSVVLVDPTRVLAGRVLRHGFLLSGAELSSLAGLPRDLAVPGLNRARAMSMPAPVAVASGGRGTKVLGDAEVGGHAVALKAPDARQHVHMLGSTGSGKSTLLLNMILDDIHAHRGTVVIDPKGDLITDLLDRIPPSLVKSLGNRFVILDPDQPAGTTLNPLAYTPGGPDPDLIVDNVVSIFSRIFAKHWGPRIDDVLRVACLTLMRRSDATLTQIPPLLNDRQYRRPFTENLDDPEGLRGFWEWFESTPPALRAQVIGPVLARLRAFLLRDFVRRTLGAPRSSFDTRQVLDGGVLLARLPKGQIGEDTSRLMGSFVLASVWQAATARARLPEPQRRDACAYVDEAHNFLNLPGSVSDMLAEARGYHLGLVVAHQNLAQMPRDTQLALSANARNKIYFSCAPEDAHQLARHTLPELSEHDLSHLDAYRAATRLVVDGRETPAFTLHTRPPKDPLQQQAAVRDLAATVTATATATAPRRSQAAAAQPATTPQSAATQATASSKPTSGPGPTLPSPTPTRTT